MKGKRIHTGIIGGSFNPVHVGHMIVASWMAQFGGFDQVWLSLSPLNPLKSGDVESLADDRHRLNMLRIAASEASMVKVCDLELHLPRPSFTYITLCELEARYPYHDFRLIIGSDNWLLFDRWRNHEEIIRRFGVTIYPRPDYVVDESSLPQGVNLSNAPIVELSSTWIRSAISAGVDVTCFLPPGVADYIREHNLYSPA